MAKKEEPFHPAFKTLKGVKIKPKALPPKTETSPVQSKKAPDDQELFEHAMNGVAPMDNDLISHDPIDPKTVVNVIRESLKRQEQEVIDTLHGLVKGTSRFDITCTGEYLEGHIVPVDPNTMKQLKSGELTIQSHLDLHGYTKQSAEQALTSFLLNAHALGQRVVLIIHGRGLKSSEGPVLKEHLVWWLTTGRLSHLILAFCSSRPCDGGTGALYVLLKRRPKKSKWKRPL